jgi:anti-anti-sigma regulatory factor
VQEAVEAHLATRPRGATTLVVCDLSASPHLDVAGARMLRKLHAALDAQGVPLAVIGAHGRVRDLLRRDGVAGMLDGVARDATLESLIARHGPPGGHAMPRHAEGDESAAGSMTGR